MSLPHVSIKTSFAKPRCDIFLQSRRKAHSQVNPIRFQFSFTHLLDETNTKLIEMWNITFNGSKYIYILVYKQVGMKNSVVETKFYTSKIEWKVSLLFLLWNSIRFVFSSMGFIVLSSNGIQSFFFGIWLQFEISTVASKINVIVRVTKINYSHESGNKNSM